MATKFISSTVMALTILLLFSLDAFPQNNKIDSLKKILLTAKDTSRVNALNELGREMRRIKSDTALLLTEQAYADAEKLNFTRGLARSMYLRTGIYSSQQLPDEHEKYMRKAITLFEKLKDYDYLCGMYQRLGELLASQCRYREGIEAYKKSLELTPRMTDNKGEKWYQAYTYNSMAYAYHGMGEYEKAYEYIKQSLELSLSFRDTFSLHTLVAYAYEGMGDLYLAFDDYETAKYYYHKSPQRILDDEWYLSFLMARIYVQAGKYDSALHLYRTYYNNHMQSLPKDPWVRHSRIQSYNFFWGQIYIGLKKFDTAIAYLEPAVINFSKTRQTRDELSALYDLSRAYIGISDFDKALHHTNELIKIAENVAMKSRLRDGYQLLSDIYEKKGDKEKANLYYRKYAELKDELKTDQFKQKLKLYKAEEEEKRKTGAIEQLKKEKQWLSIGMILLAITVASFFSFIWVQRKYNAKKRLLEKKEIALKQAEDERRIASLEMMALRSQMNPHFIFNCLNSINRFVLRNDNEAASNYLTKFSKLMRMVLENSKQALIPLEEEVKCLELYIQMEQFRCRNSFRYYVRYHDGVNVSEAMIAPLLLQPFVENAIWHGLSPKEDEGKLGIEFFQKEDALYCMIRDNGIGRKKASELKSQLSEHHKSMGLQITKERLAAMGINHSDESPVEVEDLYDEKGWPAGTQVTIRIYFLPEFEELKPSLNL